MSDEEIARLIAAAFDHGKPNRPPQQLIRSSSVEAKQVQDFFAGRRWQEITFESLQNDYVGDGGACLWFMTPEAAAYYMPAYLRIAALQYEQADSIAAEFVGKLLRVAVGEESNIADAVTLLNIEQNKVIARVLERITLRSESMSGNQDAATALRLKWYAYLL